MVYEKSDFSNLHYGWPIKFVEVDASRLDPPYPIRLLSTETSPWEDPFEILWFNLFVDLIFWLVFSLLLIGLLQRMTKKFPGSALVLCLVSSTLLLSSCGGARLAPDQAGEKRPLTSVGEATGESTTEKTKVSTNETGSAIAEVYFKKPIPLSKVLEMSRSEGVRITMLEGDYVAGGRTIHDAYPVSPRATDEQIEEGYRENRGGALGDMEDALKTGPKEEREALLPEVTEAQTSARGDSEEIEVSGLSLAGKAAKLRAFVRKNKAMFSNSHVVTMGHVKSARGSGSPVRAGRWSGKNGEKVGAPDAAIAVQA